MSSLAKYRADCGDAYDNLKSRIEGAHASFNEDMERAFTEFLEGAHMESPAMSAVPDCSTAQGPGYAGPDKKRY